MQSTMFTQTAVAYIEGVWGEITLGITLLGAANFKEILIITTHCYIVSGKKYSIRVDDFFFCAYF